MKRTTRRRNARRRNAIRGKSTVLLLVSLLLSGCVPAVESQPRTVELFVPGRLLGELPFEDRQKTLALARAVTENTVVRLERAAALEVLDPDVEMVRATAVFQPDGSTLPLHLRAGYEIVLALPASSGPRAVQLRNRSSDTIYELVVANGELP